MQSATQQYSAALSATSADAAKVAEALKNNDTSGAAAAKAQYVMDAANLASALQAFAQAAKAAGVQ